MRKIFQKSIICLIGDYLKCLTYVNDAPIFNVNSFLENKDTKHKNFYKELVSTQLFLQFLEQNSLNKHPYFNKLLLRYNNSNHLSKNKAGNLSLFNFGRNNIPANSNIISPLKSLTMKAPKKQLSESTNITNSTVIENKSNSGSKSKGSEGIYDFSEGYIIIPYFIDEVIIKSDFNKLDIHLKEKFKGNHLNTKLFTIKTFCPKES